ncbi:hypothetical protein F0919_08500 [Taibaiella lutea]|uniref:Two component regulator three Y domain-containing protein n=1 Tax=Taibaiella lutea TaxID=2608001 RepID=A0A5M6CMX3_9BACT|nr:sensor histidine kinase [Taibaiella lutea]KAA5534645.1 hypothetical protein F0919_08500 [Taibaiella lutea]
MIPCFRHPGAGLKYLIIVSFLFLIHLIHPSVLQAKAVLYDGRDGLNSNDVKCISKNTRGLIWIGTFYGLNIFDGYAFSKFQGPLSDKFITKLKNNPKTNELWVGTATGIFKINLSTLKTGKVNYLGDRKSIYSISQTQAICLNDQEVYFSFGRGYIAKVINNEAFKIVCRLPDSGSVINELVPYDKDHLIANNGSLQLVDLRTGKSESIKAFEKLGKLHSLIQKGDNLLFCGEDSKVYIANIKSIAGNPVSNPTIKSYKLPYKLITASLNDNKLYCLCENYSFLILDLATNKIDDISRKYPDIFEGKVFASLSIDENNIAWICTNKGIIKVQERSISFSKELSNIPERVSTREIYQCSNGDMYACSYAGLWYLQHGSKVWKKYGTQSSVNIKNMVVSGGYIQPISLLLHPAGDFFYVGLDAHNILKFDIKKKMFEDLEINYADSTEVLNSVADMEMDKNGKIWLANSDGLAIYDTQTNTITFHRKDKFDIGRIRVKQLYHDKANNKMYAASIYGLFVLDVDKGLIKHYTTNSVPALSNNDVFFVSKDNRNNIWIGTNGGGINMISANGKEIKYIRRQDGLSSEVVYSMIQESDNIFWFGTFNGLDRYQKDKNSFTNFFEEDGLSSNEFNHNSFLKTKENQFYFGSINGITTFRPQQFVRQVPFHIYFAGLSRWDEKSQSVQLFLQDLKTGSNIEKSPSDQLVELHFGCSDYSDPQRNAYSYRIREISNNWISLEERHTLNIGGLPYGKYTLEVKATNARGGASSNILLYNLNIRQPFYRTWWFFALALLTVGLLFYGAYLIKYQSFKKVLHLRMKIASNLHDEVGSLLTRITMFSENLRYSKNNEEQRNIKLEKIAVLSRNAVASMSDVLWTIDSRNDFAGNLLDRMREHAEEMLFPLGIDVNFVLAVNDLKRHIDSDTRGEIYLIFKEAINNIAKHSNATHVEIYYSFHDRHFHLKISNNGIKESVSEISTGQGLDNMKMRAKKIGAQITVEKRDDNFIIELKD